MPIQRRWSDLDLDFLPHPNTGDLRMQRDERAITRSLRQLLLTNHFERLFHPEVGSNLSKHLFDLLDFSTALRIKDSVAECINNYEPRVTLSHIEASPQEELNGYEIELRFFIVNEEVERRTTFFLERSR